MTMSENNLLMPEHHDAAVAYVRALCPFAEAMTDDAALTCLAYVDAKGDMSKVLQIVGGEFFHASRHVQSPTGKRVVAALMRQIVGTKGRVASMWALIDIAESNSKPSGEACGSGRTPKDQRCARHRGSRQR